MKFKVINLLLLSVIIQSCTLYHKQPVPIEEAIIGGKYIIMDNNGREFIYLSPSLKDGIYYGIDRALIKKETVRIPIEEYELNTYKKVRVINSVGQKFKFKRIHFSNGEYYGIMKNDTTKLKNGKDHVEYRIVHKQTVKIPIEESTFSAPLKVVNSLGQKFKIKKIYFKDANWYGIAKNDTIQINNSIVYKRNEALSRVMTNLAIFPLVVIVTTGSVIVGVFINTII